MIFFRDTFLGFALQVNVYLNDVGFGEVPNKTALKVTGVPAGQVCVFSRHGVSSLSWRALCMLLSMHCAVRWFSTPEHCLSQVKVGSYAVTNKPDNHQHGLEVGKTYYYQLIPAFGLVLGNFQLAWSDEKHFLKAKCRLVEKAFSPGAVDHDRAVAAAAAAVPRAAAGAAGPKSKIVIVRRSPLLYQSFHVAVDFNGKPLPGHSEIKNKEVWAVTVPAGVVTVQMHSIGVLGESLGGTREQRLDATEGQTHYFEVTVPTAWTIMHPVLTASSEEAFKKTKRVPIEFDLTKE